VSERQQSLPRRVGESERQQSLPGEWLRTAAAGMLQSFIHTDPMRTAVPAKVIQNTLHTDRMRTAATASGANPVPKFSVQIHLKCVSSYRLVSWQISLWNLHGMHSVVFHIFIVRYTQ
jgi:hypothetical protein